MADSSQGTRDDLEALAQARFRPLSEAELKLLRAAPQGKVAVCGLNLKDDDPANDPAHADAWGPEREIRGELIRWLCVDAEAAKKVDPRGIRTYAATVTGKLDLSFAHVPWPLAFFRCRLTDDANLSNAHIPGLHLVGTSTRSIIADGVNVQGDIFLREGFTAEGEVRLLCAQIGGDLDCSGGTFKNPGRRALNAVRINVRGDAFLRDGFNAEGEVALVGAQVAGNLECDRGSFKNPRKLALDAHGANVQGDLFLREGFSAEGEVRLVGALIGGQLACPRATFKNSDGEALTADHINVQGSVFLVEGFTAEGRVRLPGAQIGGQLNCAGGTFKSPGKDALTADDINVRGSIFLSDGFSARGEIRLPGAQIGGNLECTGCTFENPGGRALSADGARVTGSVFLSDKLTAEGEVRLLCAQIGRNLDCSHGYIRNPGGYALVADGARVTGSVFLTDEFSAEGAVRLVGAEIGGDLDCRGGTFTAVIAQTATVTGNFFWREVRNPVDAKLDLTNASAGAIVDHEASWPSKGKLALDGFAYARISAGPTDAKTRLEWLARVHKFTLQPYQQLAKVLQEMGDTRGARKVLFKMEERRRAEDAKRLGGLARWVVRPWGVVLRETVGFGYGYYPLKAFLWLLILVVLGCLLFRSGDVFRAMTPTEKEAFSYFRGGSPLPPAYEDFNSLIYSVENSFPFIKLGQADRWHPDPDPKWSRCSPAAGVFSYVVCRAASPRPLRWFRWVQICLGWSLATLFVAGLTGIVRSG